MPFQSRCPTCGASIPTGAAWCSLCHADLRPPAPVVTPLSSSTTVVPTGDGGRRSRTATLTAPEPTVEDLRPAGRHSREAVPMAAVPARSGRHAAGRRSPAPAPSEPLDLDLDLGEDVTPDKVEEIADQMLTHLAATEPRPAFIDYDELPGGKWGAIAGGMVALIVMIMIGSVFLNLLFNR